MLRLINATPAILFSSVIGLGICFSVPSWANEMTVSQGNHGTLDSGSSNKDAGLFVNLTSDDVHRAGMAIGFAQSVLKNGHETTIFLNITGVRIASTKIPQHTNGMTKKTAQETLQEFISQGGKVIVCPTCLEQLGLATDELIEGVIIGSPGITQPQLFGDDVRVMSW